MWHGILIDAAFIDPRFVDAHRKFAEKMAGSWRIVGVEFEDAELEWMISQIQTNMRTNAPFYLHLYSEDGDALIVIFHERIFRIKPHISTWKTVIGYGLALKVPAAQLDFWPNRFQDERHYFKPEEMLR